MVICNTDKEISDDLGKMKIEDEGILICSFSRSIPPTDLVNSHGGVSGNASGDLIISFSHPTYRDHNPNESPDFTSSATNSKRTPSSHSSCSIHNLISPSSPITRTSSCYKPSSYGTQKNARPRRFGASFFQFFSTKNEDTQSLKLELLEYIASLDRGANASSEQQDRVDQIARKLEAANKVKEPLESNLLNGKWELLYTTSQSILQTKRPKILRANGKIYQAINVDTLRAQNMETWPFFNQLYLPLFLKKMMEIVQINKNCVVLQRPIRARGSGRGQLEITYLDEELRISRGNEGNLFILRMMDPTYRVPV
ncbi:hypothetical protein E3N88_40861 [Mikania micrantha]|uniref:Plastid lipid-associated protein/fibrillin conserved domain-containing protein n=1 Tax=Mikania micrantha TaxID=192012 RepID=A0A5N6LNY3_9ASTR|nr:hypothetical protein E3N88_40861 [Mikania micrantha]